MTTITKNIQNGRFWTSQPVDAQEKREMERKLAEASAQKAALKVEFDKLQGKYNAIEDQKNEITNKIVRVHRLVLPGKRCVLTAQTECVAD
jgi:predicted nuclease with TOPRIM domain